MLGGASKPVTQRGCNPTAVPGKLPGAGHLFKFYFEQTDEGLPRIKTTEKESVPVPGTDFEGMLQPNMGTVQRLRNPGLDWS